MIPPVLVAVFLAPACRREEPRHYQVPKEPQAHAPAAAGMPPGMRGGGPGGDVPAPPRPTGPGTIQWTLPKGWTEGGGGGMRYATLNPPYPGKLEATVVVLPGQAGGELSNVNRWRGQIGLPPIDEKALPSLRKTVNSQAGPVAVFDFSSQGGAKSRMVAGLLSTPDGNTWFLKLTGDAGPVGMAQADFMRFLGSLRLEK